MKSIVYMIVFLLAISFVSALSNPVTFGGKTYYKVTSLDPTEDTGDEVCTKAGMVCNGYSESSTAVCKLFNPSAAESSSVSGDSSGVYCNGAPQSGVCFGVFLYTLACLAFIFFVPHFIANTIIYIL